MSLAAQWLGLHLPTARGHRFHASPVRELRSLQALLYDQKEKKN